MPIDLKKYFKWPGKKPSPDPQELQEREQAAQAYAGEDEKSFVDYHNDCVNSSITAKKDIRKVQKECYQTYKEAEPAYYANKEPWQSRTVVPRPFETVQYGASAIKKAFSPNFLTISDAKSDEAETFWKKVMDQQLNPKHANLPLVFSDATIMALAVGESMEMIPTFVSGRGLRFELVEPWKIHRDPDAPARDSQGGLYWIHQEWLDLFVLKQGEKAGKYFNIGRAMEINEQNANPDDPFMTLEAIAARKDQVWQRSQFRPMVLTSELWGQVLSPRGELLLPRAMYTVAGNRVIQKPQVVPYPTLRWPGTSFSPLPDLLGYGGRGLLEGVRKIWEAMNTLMCLHEDALKWIVNPPSEINVDALMYPEDVEDWPGKKYLVHDTMNGQQAVRPVVRKDVTNSVLANMQYYDQNFQRGSFVTDGIQGLPGYRKDMTFRESAQNLDQAMGVYSLMGASLEAGAVSAVSTSREMIETLAGPRDYLDVFTLEELKELGFQEGRPPKMSGWFHISGIQGMMRDAEILNSLRGIALPLADHGRFGPYIRPYKTLKAIICRTNLEDEGVIVDDKEAKVIQKGEAEAAKEMEDAAQEEQALAKTEKLFDIAGKQKALTQEEKETNHERITN